MDGLQTGKHHAVLVPSKCSAEFDRKFEDAQRVMEEDEALLALLSEELTRAEAPNPVPARVDSPNKDLPKWRRGGPLLSENEALLHQLYSDDSIESAGANLHVRAGKDSDVLRADEKLLCLLAEIGGTRRLATLGPRWEEEIAQLRIDMPNFQAVIQYIENEFLLAKKGKIAPRLAPVLLNGPPGVGKTLFARRIAQVFGSGFLQISMETAQTATTLTGSETYWANSKPGQLFTTLVEGEFANPVVLVDEVDKAGGDHRYDPASALYGLLEQDSASVWHDLAQPGLLMDVRPVIWILTANDRQRVAAPLLSRMKIFDIPLLTTDQARAAAQRIFADVVEGFNFPFSPKLPLTMAAVIATVSPREMHRVAGELLCVAVKKEREFVVQADLNEMGLNPTDLAKWAMVSVQIDVEEVAAMQSGTRH